MKNYGENIRTGVAYSSAEVRGQLRLWKQRLAQNYVTFNNAYGRLNRGDGAAEVVLDMIKGSRAGRRLAFAKIHKALGPAVTAESVSLDKRGQCFAVWSILKPRDAVVVRANRDASESERASLAQDCVTVNYVVVGAVAGKVLAAEGLWTLEVPDHALGRAVERSGFLHPETIIRDAHRNLLDMPNAALSSDGSTRFKTPYIKAGLGCFVGEFSVSEDVSIGGQLSTRVRVKTWLDDDQLHADQIVLCERGAEGDRLGDGVLAPRPFCDFEAVGGGRFQPRAMQWRTTP